MLVASFVLAVFSAIYVSMRYLVGSGGSPLRVFLATWLMCLGASLFNPAGLATVTHSTYMLLVAHVAAFSCGYLAFSQRGSNINPAPMAPSKDIFSTWLFQICFGVILVYFARRYESAVALTDIADARVVRFSIGAFFKSQYEYLLFTYGVTTSLYISIVSAACNFVLSGRASIVTILVLINALIYSTIGFGRLVVFDLVLIFAIATVVRRPRSVIGSGRRNYRVKILSISLVLVAVISMTWITASRLNVSITDAQTYARIAEVTYSQAIVYFLGPFRALDFFLHNIAERVSLETFGRATFSGVEDLLLTVFSVADIRWRTANDVMTQFTSPDIMIGADVTFNAFYTGIMNFYLDAGIVGVLAFSFVFGALLSIASNSYRKHTTVYRYALVVYVTYTAVVSQYRLPFSNSVVWLVILYILFKIVRRDGHLAGKA